eukprot:m.192004 g.192004  ORF g.192004 m.192004 type:complete len:153 (-) comp53649_c1_seq3:191-649(-)
MPSPIFRSGGTIPSVIWPIPPATSPPIPSPGPLIRNFRWSHRNCMSFPVRSMYRRNAICLIWWCLFVCLFPVAFQSTMPLNAGSLEQTSPMLIRAKRLKSISEMSAPLHSSVNQTAALPFSGPFDDECDSLSFELDGLRADEFDTGNSLFDD